MSLITQRCQKLFCLFPGAGGGGFVENHEDEASRVDDLKRHNITHQGTGRSSGNRRITEFGVGIAAEMSLPSHPHGGGHLWSHDSQSRTAERGWARR